MSISVILKATSTDRQTRRLHIFKTFCIYLASDNALIILVYSDQMTSEARTHKQCTWAACGVTDLFCKSEDDRKCNFCTQMLPCEHLKEVNLYISSTFNQLTSPHIFMRNLFVKSQKCHNLAILWRQRMPSAIKQGLHLTL